MPKRKPTSEPTLSGRLALITGANRGIGLAIARALAGEGCNLIITGRDARALGRARLELDKLNVDVLAQSCDVRSPDSVDYLFTLVRGLHRPLDILINNAGIGHPNRTVSELPYPTWMEVIDTNLNGLFLTTQAALAVMKRGSTIVNNLSIAAERVFPGSAAYNASKHGALGFTNTLREELRPKGIRVIALMPGATDTAFWDTPWPKAPRGKMMSAKTVARTVVDALLLPENTTAEEVVVMPSIGVL
ncbi:MAG TPA: SDR family oxidoreductase [Terriglobales bacterium]|jgi:NAD(P)-dependent dehydrogenase (short-subunit alcohol dehydrogenase family)|nr:SDR family oxidoreductase [Terriglobales bacterium]